MVLQVIFFICAYLMNQKMEPGEIKDIPEVDHNLSFDSQRLLELESQEELEESEEDIDRDNSVSCCRQLCNNFKLIGKAT